MFIVIFVPKTASSTEISLSEWASVPSRLIDGCFLTLTLTSKSPFMWPFPLNFRLAPSSIPLGMLISSDVVTASIPVPRQVRQGEVIFTPSPLHALHGVLRTIMPCLKEIKPVPLHVLHFWGFVPGWALLPLQDRQVAFREYSIFYNH